MTPHSETHGTCGHETTDVTIRPLVKSVVILFAVMFGALLIVWYMFRLLAVPENLQGPPPSPLAGSRIPPPSPRLQTMATQKLDLVKTRAGEDQVLNTYAWVDRKTGVVRIPVDRAIELLAQRGLPVREKK